MKITDIVTGQFSNELLQEQIVDLNTDWSFYSLIKINSSIFVGWLENDNLLIVNGDGIFLYDIVNESFILEDYDSDFKKNISSDNLRYTFKDKNVVIDIFGLRGGGGNLLTSDNTWKLEIVSIYNNYKIPRLSNYKTRKSTFFKLQEINYDGYLYCGFSKTQQYFLVMGDRGINIYKRININSGNI